MAQHKQDIERTLQSAFKHKRAGTRVAVSVMAIESLVKSGIETTEIVQNEDKKTVRRVSAGIAHRAFGKRMANALVTLDKIIQDEELGEIVSPGTPGEPAVPAETATFSGQVAGMTTNVELSAVESGDIGNSIVLVGDGDATLAALISAWNGSNPNNEVQLDSGDDSQVLDNGAEIALAGGADEVPEVPEIPAVIEPISGQDIPMVGQHKQPLSVILIENMTSRSLGLMFTHMVSKLEAVVDALLVTYGVGGDKEDSDVEDNLLLVKAAIDASKE